MREEANKLENIGELVERSTKTLQVAYLKPDNIRKVKN